MRKLGISIYPGQAGQEESLAYISKAAGYGFSRVFTCLMSVKADKNSIAGEFGQLVQYAAALGMEVVADISPSVFEELQLSYTELGFFAKLGLSGIRLDLGFSGIEESIMTCNPYGLKIEINMSNGTKYLENILSYKPNKANLLGCHNFYPHRYTGLSRKHFLDCSRQFKKQGIRTAAFVSSAAAAFGPWAVTEGLCTLEEHRGLPIEVQAKELFHTELIDDVIIANAFASDEELMLLGGLNKELLELKIKLVENAPELCRKIVLEELHFNRGDVSEYMVRSTQSRVKYKAHSFELFNPQPIKRGDILIESSLYERYAGELQIALKDMENSGKTNVVGRLDEKELFLIDQIQPWQKFKFAESR